MTVNPLPPQAYTKETFQKAYRWLQSQSISVKDMAISDDMLVSMYLKAQRSGDASLETPSIQNFKQELKNLASMIGDFQTPAQTSTIAPQQSFSNQQQPNMTFTSPLPSFTPSQQTARSMPQTFVQTASELSFLDQQSLIAIQEIKMALNLSSDIEALRALISLGSKQFKKSNI